MVDQRGLRALVVVEGEVIAEAPAGLGHGVPVVQIDAFVLDGAPESFDKHVVDPAAPTVPRRLVAVVQQPTDMLLTGKQRALLAVEAPWLASGGQGHVVCLDDVCEASRLSDCRSI